MNSTENNLGRPLALVAAVGLVLCGGGLWRESPETNESSASQVGSTKKNPPNSVDLENSESEEETRLPVTLLKVEYMQRLKNCIEGAEVLAEENLTVTCKERPVSRSGMRTRLVCHATDEEGAALSVINAYIGDASERQIGSDDTRNFTAYVGERFHTNWGEHGVTPLFWSELENTANYQTADDLASLENDLSDLCEEAVDRLMETPEDDAITRVSDLITEFADMASWQGFDSIDVNMATRDDGYHLQADFLATLEDSERELRCEIDGLPTSTDWGIIRCSQANGENGAFKQFYLEETMENPTPLLEFFEEANSW